MLWNVHRLGYSLHAVRSHDARIVLLLKAYFVKLALLTTFVIFGIGLGPWPPVSI